MNGRARILKIAILAAIIVGVLAFNHRAIVMMLKAIIYMAIATYAIFHGR